MILSAYNLEAAAAVLRMLGHCKNYAPEYATVETAEQVTDYFREAFLNEPEGGMAWILCEEGNQEVSAFVTADNHTLRNGNSALFITGLYVSVNSGKEVPKEALQMLQGVTDDRTRIFVNVHPDFKESRNFWAASGFVYRPDSSDFCNADNERLCAYEYVIQ